MTDRERVALAQLGRELEISWRALAEPGSGARGSLECRLSDLQDRLLTTPSRSLRDVEAKPHVVCALIEGLGTRGYLLNLVEATLEDVRALRSLHESVMPTDGGESS
jgi:hypothetical protein